MTQHDGNGARSTPGGYLLALEVLDYAPATLTHREKLLLVVLADDANSQTRITYSSVQDPKILRRAKLTRSQLYEALKGLVTKGVLKKITHGQQNATAKYMILPLGPAQSPESLDTENRAQSPGNRDTDGSQSPESMASESRNDGLRVRETGTPTVSTVSTASTTSSRKRDGSQQQKPNKHQVADDLTAAFWEHHGKGRAQSFIAVRQIIRTAIGNGVDRDDLARALDRVARDGFSVSGATLDIALGKIRNAKGPYRNPADQSVYDEDPTDNSNSQDDYEGDLI